MSNAELNRELSKLSVEHGEGRSKSAIKQEQLEDWSLVFLNQLREHQVKQLLANRLEEIAMMVNLRKIESAITINEPPPKRGRRSTSRANRWSRDKSESSRSGTEVGDESAAVHSPNPDRNVRLKRESHHPEHRLLPMNRRTPDQVPPGPESTILVRNIDHDFTELEVVSLLNTLNGKFSERCTALTAINVLRQQSSGESKHRSGRAYAMYASPELAKFAVDELNGLQYKGRVLRARISNRRLECENSGIGRMRLGQTRWGEDIFNFPPGY